jgi:Terpene synthase family, metal binding domain
MGTAMMKLFSILITESLAPRNFQWLLKRETNAEICIHASCRWWKNLNLGENLKYSRERLLEPYMIWSLGQYFEAEYTRHRIMNAKFDALITVMDDTFDVYGTYEECKLLNDAVQRQDILHLIRFM